MNRSILQFAVVLAAGCTLAEAQSSRTKLELRQSISRESGPGRSENFLVTAQTGQFVHVLVRKQGVDVAVSVTGPDGKRLFEVNSRTGGFGDEPVSWVASRDGDYTVTLAKAAASAETGRYEIEWQELRQPAERDGQQIRAERLLAEAVANDLVAKKESYQKALPLYESSRRLWADLGDRYEEALCLHRIGRAYSNLGENTKALEPYDQALAIRRAIGDRAGEADTLNNIGAVYSELGKMQKALEYYNQALPIRRAVGNRASEAATLYNVGLAHSDLGENERALEFFDQALTIRRAISDGANEAATLTTIGRVYDDLAQRQKALEYYNQALSIRRAMRDRAGEAETLNGIGTVYHHLAENQKALDYFTQALPIERAVGDRKLEAATLNNIAAAYHNLGDRQKAVNYYTQALPIARSIGDRKTEARTLNNIGLAYLRLGEGKKAIGYFTQALPIERSIGDQLAEANTLTNIGEAYDHVGEQNAIDYYAQALPIERAVGDRSTEAATLNDIRWFYQQSAPSLAVFFGKQAVNVLQSIRRDNRGLDPSLRERYEKSIGSYYRDLADLLVKLSRFEEAEEVLDLLKDKEAADYIRRDSISDQLRPATLLDSEKKALDRYDQIVNRIVALGQRKAELVAKRDNGQLTTAEIAESQTLDADLSAANSVLNRFLGEQQKAFAPGSALAKQVGDFRRAASVQTSLQKLGPNVVAIYTLVAEDKYVAMLVSAGARKAYTTTIARSDLNQKLFAFRQALQDPNSNPIPQAQELYRILFPEHLRQDLDSIGARTILWSMDSTLRYIPVGALHDGKGYLVERFRSSLINPESLATLTDSNSGKWQGIGFGVSQGHPPFMPLPSVPEELHRIFGVNEAQTAPVAGIVRLDGDFNKDTLQRDLTGKLNPIVHIATHFDAEPGDAANSSLLLGDGTKLTLAEMAAEDSLLTGVDLVALSACSTGFQLGTADGREVDSLGVVAQTIGAKSVIASLWSVSDEATAVEMQRFYQNWKEHPELGKSEALRLAQAQMATGALSPAATADSKDRSAHPRRSAARSAGWTHPYYWAPFILIGNMR